jgi:hypothetical protein
MKVLLSLFYRFPGPFNPNDCRTWPNAFWCPPWQRGGSARW